METNGSTSKHEENPVYIYIKKRAEAKQTDCCGAMLCLSSNQEVRELEDEARHTD